MYDDVLVPTDGSRGARVAVEHGLDLAAEHGGTVHAIHVVTPPEGLGMAGEAATVRKERGGELVAGVARRAERRSIPARTAVLEGVVHERIVDYVRDHGVDLVVMGTHGRTGIERYLLGSVAERVVRSSPVPVVTVSAESAPDVHDAETAAELAADVLRREGHDDPDLGDPHRGASGWVVPAETDRGRFNVHVTTEGDTRVARIGNAT